MKKIVRSLLIFFHVDLTKNLRYDRLTRQLMKRVIRKDSNCIDIGCHKGEILDTILKYAPSGRHYAFEPVPHLFRLLQDRFAGRASILPFALSDTNGWTTFQFVRNAPAYSGIQVRRYDCARPEIEEIQVEMRTLDESIPDDVKIHFIKIDVEGGEFAVLKGAETLLKRDQPLVIFECGLGASDYYGTDPADLYDFLTAEASLKLFTLSAYLKNGNSLTRSGFERHYQTNSEYYFIAAPA